jgi:hypothetical protein
MKRTLTYLAAPYSHKDHHMMVVRFLAINQYAAKLMSRGDYIFSPISHTHPIAEAGINGTPLPRGWDFWEGYDRRMLSCCDRILVLRLPGWEQSTGVQAEIKIGKELGIPVEYVDYDCIPPYEAIEVSVLLESIPSLSVNGVNGAKNESTDKNTISMTLASDALLRSNTLDLNVWSTL